MLSPARRHKRNAKATPADQAPGAEAEQAEYEAACFPATRASVISLCSVAALIALSRVPDACSPPPLRSDKPPPPKTNAWGADEPVSSAASKTGGTEAERPKTADKPSGPSVFDRLTNPERFPKRHREKFLPEEKKAEAAAPVAPRPRTGKAPGGFRVTPSSGIPSLEDLPPAKPKAANKKRSSLATGSAPVQSAAAEAPQAPAEASLSRDKQRA